MICKIFLYSVGFRNYNDLSKRIVQMYKLCSELLSYQSHYDYGMRNIKSTLKRARDLKQNTLKFTEEQVILKSITDHIKHKLTQHDTSIFEMICQDLFPEIVLPDSPNETLRSLLEQQLQKKNLQAPSWFLNKMLQIYDMLFIHIGIMIVGDSMSGKTTAWQILAETLKDTKIREVENFKDCDIFHRIINPKSVTIGQLYGQFDPITQEWCDGVAGKTFRDMVTMSQDMRTWLVFDSSVDSIWIENLHTLLDDNGKFCLISGEMIEKTKLMTILFEAIHLENATPATVARCGVVYMQSHQLDWKILHLSFLNELREFGHNDIYISLYEHMIKWLVPAILDILQGCKTVLYISSTNQYKVLNFKF